MSETSDSQRYNTLHKVVYTFGPVFLGVFTWFVTLNSFYVCAPKGSVQNTTLCQEQDRNQATANDTFIIPRNSTDSPLYDIPFRDKNGVYVWISSVGVTILGLLLSRHNQKKPLTSGGVVSDGALLSEEDCAPNEQSLLGRGAPASTIGSVNS